MFLQVLSSPYLSKYVQNVHLNTEEEDFKQSVTQESPNFQNTSLKHS